MTASEALAWLNAQTQTQVFIRTTLTGPAVRIYFGHKLVGQGETVEEAVEAAQRGERMVSHG